MEIYFAGSIRGGRDDNYIYNQIILELKKYGNVLTEHIGKESLTNLGEISIEDHQIYSRDIGWIEKCDILVAEVSSPSHGVGFEIAYAQHLGKPILCLYRLIEGRKISAMITGNSHLISRQYDRDSFNKVIFDFMGKTIQE